MAGLVPAIHVLAVKEGRRGCPRQARAWRGWWVDRRPAM